MFSTGAGAAGAASAMSAVNACSMTTFLSAICAHWYCFYMRHKAHPTFCVGWDGTTLRHSNWSFSCTRLNWHVAETAAREGGAIVVDATRSSVKNGFPVSVRIE